MGFFSAVKRFFGQEAAPYQSDAAPAAPDSPLPDQAEKAVADAAIGMALTQSGAQAGAKERDAEERQEKEGSGLQVSAFDPDLPDQAEKAGADAAIGMALTQSGAQAGAKERDEAKEQDEDKFGPEPPQTEATVGPQPKAPAPKPAGSFFGRLFHRSAPAAPESQADRGGAAAGPAAAPAADSDTVAPQPKEAAESAKAAAEPAMVGAQPKATEAQAAPAADLGTVAPQPGVNVGAEQTRQAASAEERALLARLRAADPRLSAWLGIILKGQEEADATFWSRLKFLLRALEAPEPEITAFAADFQRWLERMEYHYIDEFRSELQYRLALALDMEDEEDERNRLLLKLGAGLSATRERLGRGLDALFAGHGQLDAAFWEEMEELFIMADMGYEPAREIVERMKRRAAREKITEPAQARALLQDELEEIFKIQPRIRAADKPEVILMMGVNGAGKTTTIAKLAFRERMNGKKVLVAAADTFRAAAIEQLQVWADRAGAQFYAKGAGADPAAVAWEALDFAQKNDVDVVFVDTAGRLQTRVNLMEELGKIRQVLAKKQPGAPHRNMLVLDATTGQNALSQAKLFREAAGADEIALTKLDGTARGGVAIAVAMRENLPITFIGLGEKMEDLRPFNGRDFARALLWTEDN